MNYFLGVMFGIMSGLSNFTGQLLQKKSINDVLKVKSEISMKDLVKKPLWIIGILLLVVVSGIFFTLAQLLIGPVLIPGLVASGFIVLGVGSVLILKEKVKKEEIIAIAILIIGIVLISLSRLVVDGDISLFKNNSFNLRIGLFTVIMIMLWFTMFYGGKRSKKRTVLMALGAGFPFVLNNIWSLPFLIAVQELIASNITLLTIGLLITSIAIIIFVNLLGIAHLQKAMAQGNASIVVPIQQIPQQIAPIAIYYIIYMLKAPDRISYIYLFAGILLITISGFILSKRQNELEKLLKI